MSRHSIKCPDHPTHAVKHLDNSSGDGDIIFSFGYIENDVFYEFETMEPILEYEGDDILETWDLTTSNEPNGNDNDAATTK